MEKENGFALLRLFPHCNKDVLLRNRDYQSTVLLIMVTSVSMSLKMVSVAATSKQDSMQICLDVS